MTIHRSKERIKQTGEVFTSLELVDEMLSKLPEEVWAPDKTFLEPSCGDGNFLVRIVAWKIWKGSTAKQALETTYGVDMMPDNVSDSRRRIIANAFMAEQWATVHNTVLPPLNAERERQIGQLPGHDEFAREVESIIRSHIICANSLEYDYSFASVDSDCDTIKDFIAAIEPDHTS
jgi:hypothetical protein